MCIVLSLITADAWFMHSNASFIYVDVIQHCQRVKPIIDLVHKVISTDVSVADCLLPITSRIYMLLQRWVTDQHGVTNSRGTWEDVMSWKSGHLPILPKDLRSVSQWLNSPRLMFSKDYSGYRMLWCSRTIPPSLLSWMLCKFQVIKQLHVLTLPPAICWLITIHCDSLLSDEPCLVQ